VNKAPGRGDLVVVALPGDYGKPRPAVVIQSDRLTAIPTVIVCPLTSEQVDAPLVRLTIAPSSSNGLRQPSQAMVDKLQAIRRERIGQVIGRLDDELVRQLNEALAFVTGLAD